MQISRNVHSYANNENSNEYHAEDNSDSNQSMIDQVDHHR